MKTSIVCFVFALVCTGVAGIFAKLEWLVPAGLWGFYSAIWALGALLTAREE